VALRGPDSIHPNPEVERRLDHIYSLHTKDMDFRLADDTPYLQLLHALSDPHKRLPPVVHVAGTNGKGSTCAFIRSIMEAAGYRVHVYTSPHLLRFNERVRLAGKLITDDELIAFYERVYAVNAKIPVTFFEFTTALALLAFAETPADIVLLETGMGGRLDCTNVIDKPAATVITKISYDHVKFLGDTLPQIASEQAGIMKSGVPCIIGPQMNPAAVLPVFKDYATKIRAPLYIAGRDWNIALPAKPNLVGHHQEENAATALRTVEELQKQGFVISDDAKVYGITHAQWPGRMERITTGSVANDMPPGWELWFDGAHNDSGAMALADQLRAWKTAEPERPLHLIIGMAAYKDTDAYFGALKGSFDTMTFVDLPVAMVPRTAAQLYEKAGHLVPGVTVATNLHQAVAMIPGQNGRAVVGGSLYLYQMLFK
jgi:dihydrofolate synthase/folylpolyglutamate synthase